MSTSLVSQRSERLLAQNQAPGQPQTPLLPRFPAEITHKILCSLLISDEHLSFTRLPLSKKEIATRPPPRNGRNWPARFSSVLRLCLWRHCANDEPEAPALHGDFTKLCLVSKQFWQYAREIFFAKNSWILHCNSLFNALEWLLRYWGPTALAYMTNVRIELQVMKHHLVACYETLEKFVDAMKDGHELRSLSVQWIEGTSLLQTSMPSGGNWSPHVVSISRERGLERNSEGKRGRKDWEESECDGWEGSGSEPKSWAATEVVLHPLLSLRGIKQVRIEGSVTDAYAEYLEMAIGTPAGVEIPEIELLPRAKEGLNRLQKGIDVKYRNG